MFGAIVGGCLFIAVAIIVLIDGNWQGALLLVAIGAGLLLYAFRGD
ncbi:MAG: hypothetical protein PHN78_01395 [Dehalococcoidales bacterium]|nr:hypothetical protein [Dehalococcoidales bacterium]